MSPHDRKTVAALAAFLPAVTGARAQSSAAAACGAGQETILGIGKGFDIV
ncbi:hypothetical protein [Rubrivivax gelatinosus]|nr:hypothetical protein [Rubrivivax gelatinosus]